jgi:hypothetical protein
LANTSPKKQIISHSRFGRFFDLILLLLFVCLFPIKLAHAYLDPGTGSYIVQAVVGVIFGATYVFRNFIGGAFKFITGRTRKSSKDKNG